MSCVKTSRVENQPNEFRNAIFRAHVRYLAFATAWIWPLIAQSSLRGVFGGCEQCSAFTTV
jgi:hypothetical protein